MLRPLTDGGDRRLAATMLLMVNRLFQLLMLLLTMMAVAAAVVVSAIVDRRLQTIINVQPGLAGRSAAAAFSAVCRRYPSLRERTVPRLR